MRKGRHQLESTKRKIAKTLSDRHPIEERFWAKVDVQGPNDCWPWKGKVNAAGYGYICTGGRKKSLTHRVSYKIANGSIPKGLFICHHCDNPPCCNPLHLFAGNNSDNQRDALMKGRRPWRIFRAALRLESAEEIRNNRKPARFVVSG